MNWQLILKISKGILPLLIFFKSYAQINLVPNPSFEIYTVCPKIAGTPAPAPNFWSSTPIKNLPFLNSCANSTAPPYGVPYNHMGGVNNYLYAHSGNSYCGMVILNTSPLAGNYGGKRHYWQITLTDSLKAGKRYFCGFYVALSDGANYGTNNIAMCITKTALNVDTATTPSWVINANPQVYNYDNPIIKDTQNWTKITTIYKAQGGEKFTTICNFKDNANTSFDRYLPAGTYDWAVYGLDDVFVYELNSSYNLQANAGKDTTITTGDSAFIGTYTNGIDTVKWQVLNTNGTIDSIRPGFWVHPLVNTCYVLTQTVNGYTSSDTVCVTVNPLPLKFISYSVILNEVRNLEKSVENIWQTANEINVSHFYVQRSTNGKDFVTIHKEQANNQTLNNYSFIDNETRNEKQETLFYRVVSVDKDGKINYSEVREIRLNQLTDKPINVFPNPAKDVVNIECKDRIKELLIIDCLGRVVYREILRQAQNDATVINIKNLNKGLYVVQVITAKGEVKTEKLLVQ